MKWHVCRYLITGMALSSATLLASTIAIVDSGTDMRHVKIAPYAWTNPGETNNNGVDDDQNGFIDDLYGWNFAENNNKVIDYSYLGTFSDNVYKYFDVQGRYLQGSATNEEVQWMRSLSKETVFKTELQKFGNFVHGTHVAGITLKKANAKGKVVALKLIPTEVKLPAQPKEEQVRQGSNPTGALVDSLIKVGLSKLAQTQITELSKVMNYAKSVKADVVNGSFGTGFKQAESVVTSLYKMVGNNTLDEVAVKENALLFMNELIRNGKTMVQKIPSTLFVFAAGNDGSDNDELPTSPANLSANANVITVAASFGNDKLASFSNYGERTVDVAAPGVAINSSIPGNEYLMSSGTSQAAPYVAGVAALMKDKNTNLTPAQLKTILIKTVDLKAEFLGKVRSGGVVNSKRAIYAARLSATTDLANAIKLAIANVPDVPDSSEKSLGSPVLPDDLLVVPLTSQFQM